MVPLTKLTNFLKEIRDDDSGQAMVESAIVFPLYIAIICVIIETALLANTYFMTDYAAYCAARAGIVHMGDLEPMMIAASVALSSITDSSLLPVRPLNSSSPTLNSTGTLLLASAIAFLQFNEIGSGAEYVGSGLDRAVAAAIVRPREDDIGENGAKIKDNYFSINQIRMLKLNSSNDGGGPPLATEQFESREALPNKEVVGLLDEEGNASSGGYRYTVRTNAVTVKRNRIRVEVSHFHSFMFPFLPWILGLVSRRSYLEEIAFHEDDLAGSFAARIVVRGFCTMRMQSNLLEQNLTRDAHDEIHQGLPPNPFD